MKQLSIILKDLLLGVWVIIAITVTVCLLSYNEFNVPTFGKTTILAVDNDEMEPKFYAGDLLLIKRESDKKIANQDEVFFYNGNKANEYLINIKQTVFLQNFPFFSLDTVVSTVAKNTAIPDAIIKYIIAIKNV